MLKTTENFHNRLPITFVKSDDTEEMYKQQNKVSFTVFKPYG